MVLAIGGHDPSGGAGLTADIQVLSHFGCHPATVVTAITVQDTQTVHRFDPVDAGRVTDQARALLHDFTIAACKIGMLGSRANAVAVAALLAQLPTTTPVVLDPVLAAGDGNPLADAELLDALRTGILPRTTLATPNVPECRQLGGNEEIEIAARAMLRTGCSYVLVTGTHDSSRDVIHRLYQSGSVMETYRYRRLPGQYHGSGCTLASAAAALLARGAAVHAAVPRALDYTFATLQRAYRAGRGQSLPRRIETSES